MDKNAIKKFAVWARTELIARVSLKGVEYGITEDNMVDAIADSVGDKVLTADEKAQRKALIAEINDKGYKQVMEEVAYTWFNRFSALRFMEVNGYLPSHVRVFTDEENNFKPQIITEAIHLDLDGLDMEKVYALKEAEKTEELYKYLLIMQCNALNKILPGMFQKISDYTELLLPDNLLREGSVIQQMIEQIPEDDWKDAVQLIGWLYQYYNTDPKAEVDAKVKKGIKVSKQELPAKTQIFTPDWIVRYMVENSLGRLWVEGHPNDELKSQWKYYLGEAEQEPEVQAQLAEIRKEYAAMTPEQIKCIDPCCGSGHILAYMFDVLMQIYESYGYTTREAVASIVENNLYGLDIDDRAAQLAYFAVMMKARQYDRRFFSRGIQPHIYAIQESNYVDSYTLEYFCNGDAKLKAAMDSIIKEMHNAKEYGSILNIAPVDFAILHSRFREVENDIHISRDVVLNNLLPLVHIAELIVQKYDVVCTNPPYMGNGDMNDKLSSYVQEMYSIAKSDLYATFILRCQKWLLPNRFQAMVTMQSWMNLGAFEELRKQLCQTEDILCLWHLDDTLLGIAYQTSAFVLKSGRNRGYVGQYSFVSKNQYSEFSEKIADTLSSCCVASQDAFLELAGCPIAYALGKKSIESYVSSKSLSSVLVTREGMTTGNNDLFLRLWHEVSIKKKGEKWFPYNKGGEFRRWYGNNEYFVNWENEGFEIKNFKDEKTGRIRSHNYNGEYAFKPGITWSAFSSRGATFRYSTNEYLFDSKGSKGFCTESNLQYILAFLNSSVGDRYLAYFAGAKDKKPGHIIALPYRESSTYKSKIDEIVNETINLSNTDWDSFEISWDFQHHPLLRKVSTIAEAFNQWQAECDDRFNQLKANEEELNRIFIDIYGLQDELTPEVEDKDVTVRKADLGRDIRSFISYAVGCMFGRYSLDVDGLAYAGGEWDNSKYASFAADKDSIIPICDDEYFEDDIVGLFVEFVKTVYGAETLDENLKFIADALGGKGQPKDVIRNYFLSDFYSDHCKIYQKRPIYWLFDSGKKNGFKALIYMHRYQPDTIARIRTDYVHEQQARYRTAIADLEQRIANASTGERVKLNKKLTTLQAQDTEIRAYEEKIHHLADQMISIDLDDGVKKNYEIFQDVLAKIK
ncbi:BREX-1 system adenine-specific DNA-methyltransferase PglX [Enterocloster bolteae]|uniref:BREX-1 system adenine-specific DNA-methyltransferase PglX n=1 Tax=Enterocloster bolteae TaxID=208479 RepID=UPI001D08F0BA|nr:BREX-1 system adenine-specific DNA-methyltransferase PglX [Enterocloster bolteae]MCB6925864.1 BREX-1 system adenine-specific DNA-methyltransferase PglX [Enterocloster bolteae]